MIYPHPAIHHPPLRQMSNLSLGREYEDLAKLEALEDAIATAQLKQAIAEHTGFVTAVKLLSMRSDFLHL